MANNTSTSENGAIEKQNVRLFDVLLFSPILIYIGATGKMNKTIRWILVLMGVGTILYNGYYYLKYKK